MEVSNNTEGLVPDTILMGERAFDKATLLLINQAEHELQIFDPDLSRGGYQSRMCYEALQGFLAKARHNRLQLVLHNTDFFLGYCSRLQELFQTYSHCISVYLTNDSAKVVQDPLILADQRHFLHRFHINQARFKYVLDDEVAVKPLRERFGQLLEASSPTVLTTTTGL